MDALAISRIVIDTTMLILLAWFGQTTLRSRGVRIRTERLREVEHSLRRIMQDAQEASTQLSQELLRRQRDLEKTLFEVDTSEQRLQTELRQAEEQRGTLDLAVGKAQRLVAELVRQGVRLDQIESIPLTQPEGLATASQRASEPAPQRRNASEHYNHRQSSPYRDTVDHPPISLEINSDPWPEIASYRAPMQRVSAQTTVTPSASPQRARPTNAPQFTSAHPTYSGERQTERTATGVHKAQPDRQQAATERAALTRPQGNDVARNVYGEPIGQPSSAVVQQQMEQKRTLRSSVERFNEAPTKRSMESVYNAAERLLQSGHSVAEVALETALPEDEVRVLSDVVSREQELRGSESAVDPRLGVLASMRREVRTL